MSRAQLLKELREAKAKAESVVSLCQGLEESDRENRVLYRIIATDTGDAVDAITRAINRINTETEKETSLEALELSVRTFHILKRDGIDTIEQLVQKSPNEIKKIRGMGSRSYNEIVEKLEARDLSLRRY